MTLRNRIKGANNMALFIPPLIPIREILQSTSVKDVWLPTYPRMKNVKVLYIFYEPSNNFRVLYIGKTAMLRDRARWHLSGNTFVATQWETLWLDVLTVNQEEIPYDPITGRTVQSMEHYEAILIRHFLPPFNVTVKKAFKRKLSIG